MELGQGIAAGGSLAQQVNGFKRINTHLLTVEQEHGELRLAIEIAAFGCPLKPVGGFMFIAFYTPAIGKHRAQAALRHRIALASGLAQQFKGHGAVLLHAIAIQIHLPQKALRQHLTAAGRRIEQAGGQVHIPGHALALQMQGTERVLSEAAVGSDGLADQAQSGFEFGRSAIANQRQSESGLAFCITRGGCLAVPDQRLTLAALNAQAGLMQVADGSQRGTASQSSRFAKQLEGLVEQATDQGDLSLLKPLGGAGWRRLRRRRLVAAGVCGGQRQ